MVLGRKRPIPLDRWLPSIETAIDGIWARIAAATKGIETPRILFLGADQGVGTTVIAAATAVGLARNLRLPVSLVEADVRRPRLSNYLDVAPAPGLSEYLKGQASLEEARRTLDGENLIVVPGGTPRAPIPGEFATEIAKELMDDLVAGSRFVLIDAPPIQERSETRVLLGQVDAAVLVLSASSSKMEDAQRTVRLLEDVPVIGTVLNRYKPDMPFTGTPAVSS